MLYEDLEVYKDTYSLLLRTYRDMSKLPRDLKYTHLEALRGDLFEILALIYDANAGGYEQKIQSISRARRLIMDVKLRFRILRDLDAISHGLHVECAYTTVVISKQLSSWEQYVRKQMKNKACSIGPESSE